MRKLYVHLLATSALLCVVIGCERRPLEDEIYDYASVIVDIDWSETSLNPEEATVVFYPEGGSPPLYLYMSSRRGSIRLPLGNYAVIAINNKFEDFDAIAFRNEGQYSTLEAYVKPISSYGNYLQQAGESIGDTPDLLASDSRDFFTVTSQMVDRIAPSPSQSYAAEAADITLRPVEVVAQTRLTVHVQNMHLIRNGSRSAALSGFAESIMLFNRKTTNSQVTHILKLPHAEYYKNDDKNGFMQDNFTVLGFSRLSEGRVNPVHFTFQAVLRDKDMTVFSYEIDVTDIIEVVVELGVKININIGIAPVEGNPPVPIPPVEPDESDAFKPNVDDWEDVEVVKPMK